MNQPQRAAGPYTLWVVVMKNGAWLPDSKYAWDQIPRALQRGEELDKSPDCDAVRVLRIANDGSGAQKELWSSSRLNVREDARRANALSAGMAKSVEQFSRKRPGT